MYKVAFVVSSGELVTYPWMNLRTLFPNNNLYEFVLFQQEHCARLFSEMELGSFDGVVFSSNVSNDDQVRELILSKRETIKRYIAMGKGVLILMQYHLAQANSAFDIISKDLFGGTEITNATTQEDSLFGVKHLSESGELMTREQNSVVTTEGKLDPEKVYFDTDSILLSYPNKICLETMFLKSQRCRFVRVFAPAYIDYYPHAYFSAPICLRIEDNSSTINKPLIIYSGNENKRVVITTLPLDLQEQVDILENIISYIVRGRPDAILWKDASCSNCLGRCDTQDYLNKARIHFVDILEEDAENSINIINRAKYILACSETAFASYRKNVTGIALPIKTSLNSVLSASALANDRNIIVDVPTVSQIEMWANQGFDYLLNRFPQNNRINNKWDNLYATRQVVLLAKEIQRSIPAYICEQIQRYLESHNKDKKTFDKVARASFAAADICEALNISLSFERDPNYEENRPIISEDISTVSLFDLAQYVLVTDEVAKIPEIYRITARFISERNAEKASWDDDVLTTASVLRALLKIDRCSQINTRVTNVVCSCYQNSYGAELSASLVASIERARQSEYDVRLELENSRIESNKRIEELNDDLNNSVLENDSIKNEKERIDKELSDSKDLTNSLKNRNSRLGAWLISIAGFATYLVFLLVAFVLASKSFNRNDYVPSVVNFLTSWGVGGAIVDFVAILVAITLFKVLYSTDIRRKRKERKKKDE